MLLNAISIWLHNGVFTSCIWIIIRVIFIYLCFVVSDEEWIFVSIFAASIGIFVIFMWFFVENEYLLEQLKEKERYDQPWFIVSLFKKRVMINSIVWARKGWKTQERNIIQYKYKLFQVLMNQHNNFNSRSLPIVRYIRSLFLNMLALHSRNYRNWTMLEQCP